MLPSRLLAFGALLAVLALAPAAGAQTLRLADGFTVPASCQAPDGRPPRAPTLVNVAAADPFVRYKGGSFYPPVPDAAWRSVALLTEMIAGHARTRLGAREGALPALDSARREPDYRGFVLIVARRDGSIRPLAPWEVVPDAAVERLRGAMERPGVRLLLDAADDVVRAGEPFMWPEKLRGDSLVFMLRWAWPAPDGRGGWEPMPFQYAAGVVPMVVEVQRGPVPLDRPSLRLNRTPAAADTVIEIRLRFSVDSAGRTIAGSVQDLWPDSLPRPAGRRARDFEAHVRALRRAIEGQRFIPARVGACRVPATVDQVHLFVYDGTPVRRAR